MRPPAWARFLVAFALAEQATHALACACLAVEGARAARWMADPVDVRVRADDGMVGVNQDDLKPGTPAVLCKIVGVEHDQIGVFPLHALLGDDLVVLAQCKVAPHILRLAPSAELRPLMSATLDTLTDDDESRLCFVANGTGAVKPCRMINTCCYVFSTPLDEALAP